jgi:hypothetical protein
MTDAARQSSDDGLWEWDEERWVRKRRIGLQCDRCGTEAWVKPGENEFECPEGHVQDAVRCLSCENYYQQGWAEGDGGSFFLLVACPRCDSTGAISVPVAEWVAGKDERRVISDFTLAASGGTSIPDDSPCIIGFSTSGLVIDAPNRQDRLTYEEIQAVQVSGSTTTTSAGVWGGGFGLEGAAEGMLVASVINAVTRRTKRYAVLRIAASSAEYVFVSHSVDSNALQMTLTPVVFRIRQAQASPPTTAAPAASGRVADELRKLAKLRDEAVLNDAEFAAAKARLLGDN